MNQKTTSAIISLVILSGIAYLAYLSFKPEPFKGEAKEAIFTITKFIPLKNGYSAYYNFECNGVIVEEHGGSKRNWTTQGEKFRGFYDKEDCENFKVEFTDPLFLSGERTDTTIGTIKEIGETAVYYTFKVDNYLVEKLQFMKDGFQVKYPEIREGEKFMVEYWLKDVQRAIIHFESKKIKTSAQQQINSSRL